MDYEDDEYGTFFGLEGGGGPLSRVGGALGGAAPGRQPGAALDSAAVRLLTAPGMSNTPRTGLDLLREYAIKYLPNQEELAQARAEARAAYEAQAQAISQPSAAESAAPWFAFAGGMGAPTRTGQFWESAAAGSTALARALENQAGRDALTKREAAILRTKGPERRVTDLESDLKTALPALTRTAVADRTAAMGRYKIVPRVGLVDLEKLDASGNPTVVVRGDDTREVLAKFATGLMRIAGDPTRMKFDSPQQMMQWVQERTLELGRRVMIGAQPGEPEAEVGEVLRGLQAPPAEKPPGVAPPPQPGAPQPVPAPVPGAPPGPGPVAASPPPSPVAAPPATLRAAPGTTNKLVQDVLNAPNATPQDREAVLAALAAQNQVPPGPPAAAPAAPPAADLGLAAQNQRELARVPPPAPPLPPVQIPMGLTPSSYRFLPTKPTVSGPQVVDPVAQAGAKETATEGAKLAEQGYAKEIMPAVDVAQDMLTNVKLWRSIGDVSSRAAPIQEWLGAWMQAAGRDNKMVKKATEIQELNKIMMQEVLRQQILQKGVQTEGDATRMQQAWAQIQNTPEANEFILRMTEAKARRVLERAQFYDAYRERNRTLVGAGAAWNKYLNNTPLVKLKGGRVIYYYEWLEKAQELNPGASPEQFHEGWKAYAPG